jgi:hypothetical protein
MNLDELEPYEALDVLENMLEQELTTHQRCVRSKRTFQGEVKNLIYMNGKDAYRFNFNCYYHIKIEKKNRS